MTRVAGEAQQQCGTRARGFVKPAHRPDNDAARARGVFDIDIRYAAAKITDEMEALVRVFNGNDVACLTREAGNERVTLVAVQKAHAADMSNQVTLSHEFSKNSLV